MKTKLWITLVLGLVAVTVLLIGNKSPQKQNFKFWDDDDDDDDDDWEDEEFLD